MDRGERANVGNACTRSRSSQPAHSRRKPLVARRRPGCEHVFGHDHRVRPLPPVRAAGGARRPPRCCSRSRPRWRLRPGASRWWGRCPRRPRRLGSCAGCGWGRRCRAARRCGSCRRTPRACARSGARCSTGSRGSGRSWSRTTPARPSSSPAASRDPRRRPRRRAGGGPPRARGGRPLRRRAEPLRRARGGTPGAATAARPGASRSPQCRRCRGERCATSSLRCRSRCCAPGPSSRRFPRCSSGSGIRTLGELAALPSRAVAERFGHPGLLALDLSRGRDTPLEPRRPFEPVVERLDLPEAASGQQLERALELLIARVLARRERRGRSLRALAVSARFVAGGTWRTAVTLRHASADPARIRLALAQKLAELPAPSESLGARGRGVRPAGAGPGAPARRGGLGAPRAARRGRPPGAPGGGRRRRPARARRGSRLAHPRAPRGAGAVPGRVVTPGRAQARRAGSAPPSRPR